MKRWRDVPPSERLALACRALELAKNNHARAARYLGISRQHLYRIRAQLGRRHVTHVTCDTPTSETVTSLDMCQQTRVGSALHVDNADCVTMLVTLPRELKEWTERTAVEWAHSRRIARPAKSAVVVRALLDLRERGAAGATA